MFRRTPLDIVHGIVSVIQYRILTAFRTGHAARWMPNPLLLGGSVDGAEHLAVLFDGLLFWGAAIPMF